MEKMLRVRVIKPRGVYENIFFKHNCTIESVYDILEDLGYDIVSIGLVLVDDLKKLEEGKETVKVLGKIDSGAGASIFFK